MRTTTIGVGPGLTISVEGEAGNGEDHDDGCKKDHVDCGKSGSSYCGKCCCSFLTSM